MATKYTHGKSKGTSDRKSSGRLSSPGGETGAPIQKFKLTGTTTAAAPLNISNQDYFQSKPLSFPQAPNIPDAPKRPDDSQNLKNLATAFGEVNSNLQKFTTDFWDFQKAMDKSARKREEIQAEEGKDKNAQLNSAKNALEKKAETNEEAASSYGLFASMDQRVEREYVVVTAKRDAMDTITNLPSLLEEVYQESFNDPTREDESGSIVPLNPSSPEFTQAANALIATKIPNFPSI